MTSTITTKKAGNILYLKGELNLNTINKAWKLINGTLNDFDTISLKEINHIDSSGVALLTHFCLKEQIKLQAINENLKMLISLYDLDKLIS